MKSFLTFLLFFVPGPLAWAGDVTPEWSKADNDLRGRLIVRPPKDASTHFYRVYLELENVADTMGQRTIPFDLTRITFRVTGKDGRELARAAVASYDGLKPNWQPTLLPTEGAIRFRISYPGMGYFPKDPPAIDLGPTACWTIPREDGPYYLAGTLKIARDRKAHPYQDWYGTLELPPAEIPAAK